MFGITRCIMRGASRQQLTAKRGRNHYKGTGSGSMGRHTKRGRYVIEWEKVRSFVVPDLTDFKVNRWIEQKIFLRCYSFKLYIVVNYTTFAWI
ncbi:mitochondrial ribosomal protein L27-domain-containing protein [Lobosporangium transversale]|uniref:Mitochondrial ribosomal protein L27-domain-containing protein n=1 Tax=Lobosporangium transversale TaxID=64571 RepID=A0A1Y2GZR1_9FUNG|nr:mitochondrial ribosomal protein L27-domain-containing protein [Lobosporangium transversale]ORZ27789.1 mitochondrial ribosomal protein L27-domain-containing protein [Lobosporangium transversale]|eukprot:XP_021885492.1 mitochondrial ribosomal protein L27-domain-containing protein [Lobosporangium transversale]